VFCGFFGFLLRRGEVIVEGLLRSCGETKRVWAFKWGRNPFFLVKQILFFFARNLL